MSKQLLGNMFAAVAALFITLLCTGTAHAQVETYDLFINGVQVTADNCNDLTTIEGVGAFGGETPLLKYDPETKTLTMQGVEIKTTSIGIQGDIDGLTIKQMGFNVIHGDGNYMRLTKPTTILGPTNGQGVLQLVAAASETGTTGIYSSSDLTIKDCGVYVSDVGSGIVGVNGEQGEDLVIDNALVTVFKSGVCAIGNWSSVTLNDCVITGPEGAAFDSTLHGIAKDGALVKEVSIDNFVGLEIGGEPVTLRNCDDLSVIDGVSGTVAYSPETKTLTLQDATINVSGTAIHSEVDGLTIKVIGNNSIQSVVMGISSTGSVLILGAGINDILILDVVESMKIAMHPCAIETPRTDLTIKNCSVYVTSEGNGISGDAVGPEIQPNLIIDNALVEVVGGSTNIDYPILNWYSVTLNDCAITLPEGAAFDSTLHGIAKDGALVNGKVVIKPVIDLLIAGKKVTLDNCNDLSVINGVEGTVKYDPATNTLTLQDATISNGNAIYAHEQLNIKLIGNNTIEGSNAIDLSDPTTISGDGSLSVRAVTGASYAIQLRSAPLTIENTTVNLLSSGNTITGSNSTGQALLIKNSNVTIESVGAHAMGNWEGTFTLEDCVFTEPEGAAFDSTLKGIAKDGALVKKVVIVPILKFAVTYSAGEGGTISATVPGGSEVEKGTSVTFTATPDTGYKLKEWTVNGVTQSSKEATLTLVIDAATDVKVTFEQEESVEALTADALAVYPNPASNLLNVSGLAVGAEARLVSLAGKVVATAQADARGVAVLDVVTLPAGEYLLLTPAAGRKVAIRR